MRAWDSAGPGCDNFELQLASKDSYSAALDEPDVHITNSAIMAMLTGHSDRSAGARWRLKTIFNRFFSVVLVMVWTSIVVDGAVKEVRPGNVGPEAKPMSIAEAPVLAFEGGDRDNETPPRPAKLSVTSKALTTINSARMNRARVVRKDSTLK